MRNLSLSFQATTTTTFKNLDDWDFFCINNYIYQKIPQVYTSCLDEKGKNAISWYKRPNLAYFKDRQEVTSLIIIKKENDD